MDAINPLIDRVIDGAVRVTVFRQTAVRDPLVCADDRSGADILKDVSFEGSFARVRDYAGHDITGALGHAEHYCLTRRATAALAARAASADVGFVGLDVTPERRIAVNPRHVLANLMAHAPRRFVRHTKLALEFLGGHAMAGSREQVEGIKPFRKRGVGPLEKRAFHGANLIPAPLAAIDRALMQSVKLAMASAARAVQGLAVANPHKVIQACIVVWEPLEKLVNRGCLGHVRVLLPINMGRAVT